MYVYPFNITGTLEQTDWSEIALCSQFGQAKNYFSVGDQKTVSINGTNYKVQIIGFDHDQLTSGGMAGITFQSWRGSGLQTDKELSNTINKFGINAGAGFEMNLSQRLDLHIEGKYIFIDRFHQANISIGLGYKF